MEIAGIEAELPSTGLLSFYDRLRERVAAAVGERSRLSRTTAEALLLVPDLFILLVRLALDSEVPRSSRRLIGGALVYFVLPVDLLPEAFLGVGGFLDDLVLSCAVLAEAFSDDLMPYAERHWSGSRRLGGVVRDVSRAAGALLGADLYERLHDLLRKRGISLRP